MSAFLLKLDENLAHGDFLNGIGYSAERVTDEGLSGAEDAVVWQRAVAEGRFFLTLDLDFADVRRFPPGSHEGAALVAAAQSQSGCRAGNPPARRSRTILGQLGGLLRGRRHQSHAHPPSPTSRFFPVSQCAKAKDAPDIGPAAWQALWLDVDEAAK